MTEACGATPVLSKATTSACGQRCTPAWRSVGQRRGQPVLHGDQPARQGLPLLLGPQAVAGGVASGAVAQPVHQVSAALVVRHLRGGQCLRCRGGWLGCVCRGEEQGPPHAQRRLGAVWKAQRMRLVGLRHRRQALQVGKDGVGVFARDVGVAGVRKGGVQQPPVLATAVVHGAPELGRRPRAQAGGFVGCEVGAVDHAKRRFNAAPARKRRAALHRVAGHAVAQAGQVFALRHQGGGGLQGFGAGQGVLTAQVQGHDGGGADAQGGHRARHQPQKALRVHGRPPSATPPQRAGMGPDRLATGLPLPGTGCAASQADTALTSSGVS